ncbi:MAG: CoA ester lyase [Chloroflexota bacterium]|nr:CoA ester lyase [Chloroflexota bacterium]
MELIKTVLSVPGNRENMIEKSQQLNADVIVLDLEDSVPYQEKARARNIVREWLPRLTGNGSKTYVRINPLDGGMAREDMDAVTIPELDGISQPKPSTGRDIAEVDALLTRLEKERGIAEGHVKMLPWIETAKGLINAYEIAGASPRIVGVIFGANDLVLETGMIRSEEGTELLYPRTKVVIAARAAGVLAIDTPFNDFKDEDGLINEADLARKLGFDGKFIIHPSQIETVARIFCPTEDEVAHATRVLTAFEEATAKGFASASLEGKMIDIPIAQRALKIILLAKNMLHREK